MIIRKSLVVLAFTVFVAQANAAEVLQFLGQSVTTTMDAVLTPTQISDAGIANPDDYACFQMVMRDPATGAVLGSGIDCLIFPPIPGQIVNGNGLQNGAAFQNLAGDVAVDAVSIFSFSTGDVVVTSGLTSVRLFLAGFGDGGVPARTHVTGSIPGPSSNSVLLATGGHAGQQGPVRVSGALTLDTNGIYFDCLWVLDI